jgi:hypothetical protein
MIAGASQPGGTGLGHAETACRSLSPDVRSTGSRWPPVLLPGPAGRPGSSSVAAVGSRGRRLRRPGSAFMQQTLALWAVRRCPTNSR